MSDLHPKSLNAHSAAQNSELSFEALFKYQFVLSETPVQTSPDWQSHELANWHLSHCPKLKTTPVLDSEGRIVGALLGIAVDQDGKKIDEKLVIPASLTSPAFWTSFEATHFGIAGRYAIVMATHDQQRIYFDMALDQAVVFNPKQRLIASSVTLATTGELQDHPLYDHHAVLHSMRYYAFEHTRDRRVLRARPNHYLDMKSMMLVRHWPSEEDAFDVRRDSRQDLLESIHQRFNSVVKGFVDGFDCCLPLSGGRDSRLLFAHAISGQSSLAAVYSHSTNHNTLVDAAIARKICDAFGQEHHNVNFFEHAESDLNKKVQIRRRFWNAAIRNGYESGTRDPRTGLVTHLSPRHEVLLRGTLMEIISAQQYTGPILEQEFDLDHALARLRIPEQTLEENKEAFAELYLDWADTLPDAALPRIYDMAFLELVQPHAMGALMNQWTECYYVNPFNDRKLMHATIRLRPKFRFKRGAMSWLQNRINPEMAGFPYTPQIKVSVMKNLGKSPDYQKILDTPEVWNV